MIVITGQKKNWQTVSNSETKGVENMSQCRELDSKMFKLAVKLVSSVPHASRK